jgi:hypothetical protein
VATTNTATVAVQVCVAALLPCISVMSLDMKAPHGRPS